VRDDAGVVNERSFAELDPRVLYEVLRLRIDVFVVEQACAFGDLDGRDLEPDARHLWIEEDGAVVAYARLLRDPGATQIGRVVTRTDRRGTRLGVRLMTEALARTDGPVVIKAQERLADWYRQFGFEISGLCFIEDGIPHVPMRLER
jgi:ElaA protein